jgi:hypothetical protein
LYTHAEFLEYFGEAEVQQIWENAPKQVLADEHETLKDAKLKVRSCDCDENIPQDLDEEEPLQPQVSGLSQTSTRSSMTRTTRSESLDDEMLRRYERGGLTPFSDEDGESYSTPDIDDKKTPAAILAEKSTMDLCRESLDRIKIPTAYEKRFMALLSCTRQYSHMSFRSYSSAICV